MLVFFGNLVSAVVILALQQILTVRFSSYVELPDLMVLFFVLRIVFGNIENNKWLFLVAFVIGAIVSVWSGRPLGFDSLVYAVPTYIFYALKEHISMGIFLFLIVFLSTFIIKFLLYILVGIVFRYRVLYSFAISTTFWYVFVITLVLSLIVYSVLKIINKIRGVSYVEE